MSQTSITMYPPLAHEGMADGIGPITVNSFAVAESVGVGKAVELVTPVGGIASIKPSLTGAATVGLTLHDYAREFTYTNPKEVGYNPTEVASVVTYGRMWVKTSGPVAAFKTANLKVSDGTFTDAAVGSGVEAFTQIKVTFATGTTEAGLAIVEIK